MRHSPKIKLWNPTRSFVLAHFLKSDMEALVRTGEAERRCQSCGSSLDEKGQGADSYCGAGARPHTVSYIATPTFRNVTQSTCSITAEDMQAAVGIVGDAGVPAPRHAVKAARDKINEFDPKTIALRRKEAIKNLEAAIEYYAQRQRERQQRENIRVREQKQAAHQQHSENRHVRRRSKRFRKKQRQEQARAASM